MIPLSENFLNIFMYFPIQLFSPCTYIFWQKITAQGILLLLSPENPASMIKCIRKKAAGCNRLHPAAVSLLFLFILPFHCPAGWPPVLRRAAQPVHGRASRKHSLFRFPGKIPRCPDRRSALRTHRDAGSAWPGVRGKWRAASSFPHLPGQSF